MIKTVDNTNLGYLISKIKAAFWPKADVVQIGLDNSPTQNSDNLVKSGGVYNAVAAKYTKPANGIPASDLESGVIPAAPGTLDTTATTAQQTSASEALSGSVKLHKVAKTGTFSDLLGLPTIDATPTNASTNAVQSGGVYSALADRYTKAELAAMAETWTFTLDDNSTVTKKIIVLPNA